MDTKKLNIILFLVILVGIYFICTGLFRLFTSVSNGDFAIKDKSQIKDIGQKSQAEKRKVKSTKSELKKNLEYAENEIKNLKTERDQLRKDYVFLVGKLRELEEELREAHSGRSTAPQSDSSKEADKWRKAYETSRDEFRIAAQGRQEALNEVEKLKAQLAEKDKIIENLKRPSVNFKKKFNSGLDTSLVESFCKIVSTLENATKDLPIYYYEIPTDPPKGEDDIAVLPICAKYDKRFWVKMFLLRNHVVVSQVINSYDMLDYQIPIKTENELLIVLVYWRRFTGVPLQCVHEPIGKDLTPGDEYEFEVCCHNTILHTISLARYIEGLVKKSGMDCWNEFIMLPDYKTYQNCFAIIERWVDIMYEQISTSREFALPVKWKSEYTLYKYFQVLFPDTIYQYHADWLDLQSLDMYIPSIHTAVEYQGKQHYEPVEIFGGEEKLADNQYRDAVKHDKCRSHGINLCYWEYTTKIRFKTILSFLDYAKIPRPDLVKSLNRDTPFVAMELFASAVDGK